MVTSPVLRWTMAEAGEMSWVSISFHLRRPTDMVRAVLIVLPEGFEHEIQVMRDLRVARHNGGTGGEFPVAANEGAYVYTQDPGSVRVLVRDGAMIPSGGYAFEM